MIYSINRIFLMLGRKCNLNCKYCLQHDMTIDDSTVISQKVIDWLRKCIQTQDRRLNVTFYGGEPLIYWKAIEQVVHEFGNYVSYSIITNGALLDAKKVEFINNNHITVTVSWDGRNVMKTRGYDVLAENCEIIGIDSLTLSSVVSNMVYPKDFLDAAEPFMESYRKLHGRYPRLNIDTIMDFGNCSDMTGMDLDKLRSQMEEIATSNNPVYKAYRERYYTFDALIDKTEASHAVCGNGITTWNIDAEGNVYRCHNSEGTLGTVDDSLQKLLLKAMSKDSTSTFYQKDCSGCIAEKLCRGGCPLVTDEARHGYYCSIKRAFYGPLVEAINKPTHEGKEIIIS